MHVYNEICDSKTGFPLQTFLKAVKEPEKTSSPPSPPSLKSRASK